MCGIYGTTFLYDSDTIKRKLERIRFRGPDHLKFKSYSYGEKRVTLGHVRLSIIDLDARSNQPFDYNNVISIVFNGEIYNYKELVKCYLADVSLKTTSDTEVICALYEKFGYDSVKFLNGMFSFVIFDKDKNIFWGARDRLGKKPFYYYHTNDGFEFSSQLSQIALNKHFNIDSRARLFYLINGCVPDPFTIYSEVKKLQAGHSFVYNIRTNEFYDYEYWNLFSNSCGFSAPKSYEEARKQVKDLLEDSVNLRLNADVPVGGFLSGGIDSSLVAAIVSKKRPELVMFNIGFKEKKYDESEYAKIIAQHLGVNMVTTICDTQEMLDMLEKYSYYFDEPFADVSLIPTSLVCKKAREHVTVVLGGDGGDESYFGYNSYHNFAIMHRAYQFPLAVKSLYRLIRHIPSMKRISNRMRFNNEYEAALSGSCQYFGAELYKDLEVMKSAPHAELLNPRRGLYSISDYQIATYLNDDINTKADRAAMRFSLELRSPLMDYRLFEYSRLLPYSYLWNKKWGGKRILKDILSDYLPTDLFMRKKMGFGAPIEKWFRNELRKSFIESIDYDNISAMLPELDPCRVIEIRDEFLKGNDSYTKCLWTIYSYVQWEKHQSM